MIQIVQSTAEMLPTLTKLTYIVLYPPGEQMLPNGAIVRNIDIATDALNSLINSGGISLPTGCGWAVQIINNDTGEVTTIGKTE